MYCMRMEPQVLAETHELCESVSIKPWHLTNQCVIDFLRRQIRIDYFESERDANERSTNIYNCKIV